MTQINFYETETDTDIENRLVVAKWAVGEGWIRSLELVDANYYVWNGQITRSYSIAQGTIFNIL